MSKEERKNTEAVEKGAQEQTLKASVYESTDNKDSGRVIHTRIYCFETNQPILKKS